MDARKVKKMITWLSLEKMVDADWDEIALMIFEKDERDLTEAERNRYNTVLDEMRENAERRVMPLWTEEK